MVGELVLPELIDGITEASSPRRRPSRPGRPIRHLKALP